MKAHGTMKKLRAFELGEGLEHADGSKYTDCPVLVVFPFGLTKKLVVRQRGVRHDGEGKFIEVLEELSEEDWYTLWAKSPGLMTPKKG